MCCSPKKRYDTTIYPNSGRCGSGSGWFARRAAKKAMKALDAAAVDAKTAPAPAFNYPIGQDVPAQIANNNHKASSQLEKLYFGGSKSNPSSITSNSDRSSARLPRMAQVQDTANAGAPPSYHETIIRDAASARRRQNMNVERYRVAGH